MVIATWAILARSEAPAANPRFKFCDLYQTVIGNPAHDLIRLSLSLHLAARGVGPTGLTTVKMVERIMEDYHGAFARGFDGVSRHQRA